MKEIKKGKKFAKRGNIALSERQTCNADIPISNVKTNSHIIKKQSYASVEVLKPSQVYENLQTQVKYKNQ